MDPITLALFAVGTAASVAGTVSSGVAAKQEAELDVFNIETEAKFSSAAASQAARARMEDYDSATATNIASFAASGRDIGSDRSIKAFMDRQKDIAGEDVARIQKQKSREAVRYAAESASTRLRGKNALKSSLFQAAGQATQGYSQYQDMK